MRNHDDFNERSAEGNEITYNYLSRKGSFIFMSLGKQEKFNVNAARQRERDGGDSVTVTGFNHAGITPVAMCRRP
jgi:hypothetical protein